MEIAIHMRLNGKYQRCPTQTHGFSQKKWDRIKIKGHLSIKRENQFLLHFSFQNYTPQCHNFLRELRGVFYVGTFSSQTDRTCWLYTWSNDFARRMIFTFFFFIILKYHEFSSENILYWTYFLQPYQRQSQHEDALHCLISLKWILLWYLILLVTIPALCWK